MTPEAVREFVQMAIGESVKHTHHAKTWRKCPVCGVTGRIDMYCKCFSAADITAAEAFIAARPH